MTHPVIQSAKDKLEDLNLKVNTHVGRAVSSPFVKATDKIKKVESKDRWMAAGLGGLAGLGTSIVVPMALSKILRRPVPLSLAERAMIAATGIAAGYSGPDVKNILIKEKRGKISREKSNELLYGHAKMQEDKFKRMMAMGAKKEPAEKTAGLVGSALKGVGGLVREGFRFGSKRPLGTRIWSGAFKTGLVGGAIYGGNRLAKNLKYRSGPNYTTFLRNQTLAGNIRPEEMTQSDLINVKNLGMR